LKENRGDDVSDIVGGAPHPNPLPIPTKGRDGERESGLRFPLPPKGERVRVRGW